VNDGKVVAESIKDVAVDANKSLALLEQIVERRIEVLLGTLIAYQMGLLDKLVTYGAGMC
jgi:predicted methyltransferase MtxX (methanogen marker protein 4)